MQSALLLIIIIFSAFILKSFIFLDRSRFLVTTHQFNHQAQYLGPNNYVWVTIFMVVAKIHIHIIYHILY